MLARKLAATKGSATPSQQATAAQSFAPRNNTQAALGYGAAALGGVLEGLQERKQASAMAQGAEYTAAMLRKLGGPFDAVTGEARMDAAIRAAPYCHPRLAAIEAKVDGSLTVEIIRFGSDAEIDKIDG